MRLKLNTGICPVVNVGMYESILDPRYLFDCCDSEIEAAKTLTDEEKTYYFDTLSNKFDSKKYKEVVARYASDILKSIFSDIADRVKVELCAGISIDSPPFYNYRSK